MNPLNEIVPPKYRKIVYVVILLLSLAFSAYSVAEEDLVQAAIIFFNALASGVAASNVNEEVSSK